MSNEMCARNTHVESPRFPGEGSSAQGKSGPKPRTKSRRRWITGGDSSTTFMSEALTQKDSMSRLMVEPVQAVRLVCSEVRIPKGGAVMGSEKQVVKHVNPGWQEKALVMLRVPVPQTDAGGRGENPKTNERTLVKELGKMTP